MFLAWATSFPSEPTGLRVRSEEYGAITLPEYFYKRAGTHGNIVRVISMLIIVFFFSFYVGAQFIGAGKVLNVTFGFPHFAGMIVGAFVIIVYTMMGGFFAYNGVGISMMMAKFSLHWRPKALGACSFRGTGCL